VCPRFWFHLFEPQCLHLHWTITLPVLPWKGFNVLQVLPTGIYSVIFAILLCAPRHSFSKLLHKRDMNIASNYCCIMRPPCWYRNAVDWPAIVFFLSTHCWCLLPRLELRLDLSAPTTARSNWYVCCASLHSCGSFLRESYDLLVKSFCDPFCLFCTEILHCCAVLLHCDIDVCKVMLQIFCGCCETSLHTPHYQVMRMLYLVARCIYSL
jgi:hypothetical protein